MQEFTNTKRSMQQHQKEYVHEQLNSGIKTNLFQARKMVRNLNPGLVGFVFISGWFFLSMKSYEHLLGDVLPAYIIICCLFFIKAIGSSK
jgi:hypothetical protein